MLDGVLGAISFADSAGKTGQGRHPQPARGPALGGKTAHGGLVAMEELEMASIPDDIAN